MVTRWPKSCKTLPMVFWSSVICALLPSLHVHSGNITHTHTDCSPFHPPPHPHPRQLQAVKETLTSPVHSPAILCSWSFPFSLPSQATSSLCPEGRKATPDCSSQPRPTSCSDQQDARIPIACLSLSPAGPVSYRKASRSVRLTLGLRGLG